MVRPIGRTRQMNMGACSRRTAKNGSTASGRAIWWKKWRRSLKKIAYERRRFACAVAMVRASQTRKSGIVGRRILAMEVTAFTALEKAAQSTMDRARLASLRIAKYRFVAT
jgi:hypothetical protein